MTFLELPVVGEYCVEVRVSFRGKGGSEVPEHLQHLKSELTRLALYVYSVHSLAYKSDARPPPEDVLRESAEELMTTLFKQRSWPTAKLAARVRVMDIYTPYLSDEFQQLVRSIGHIADDPLRPLAIMAEALIRRVPLAALRAEYPRRAVREALRVVAELKDRYHRE